MAAPKIIKPRIEILDIAPPIWRQIAVPDDLTLDQLHLVIQEAFGWTDSHLHDFRTETQRFSGTTDEPAEECGDRACPPEDCGSTPGYERLIEVMKKPEHPEHEELLEWLGGRPFDPEAFDLKKANARVRKLIRPVRKSHRGRRRTARKRRN